MQKLFRIFHFNNSIMPKKIVFIFITVIFSEISIAQSNKILTKEIADLVSSFYNSDTSFSAVILVENENGIIYKNAKGYANYELGVPLQLDTKFRLASVSKQFTAVIGLILAEQSVINLMSPISVYVPAFEGKEIGNVNLYQILTNTSGIKNDRFIFDYANLRIAKPFNTDVFIDSLKTEKLEFAPGTKMNYSNTGFALASVIFEKITGKNYEQVLRELIFDKIGMTNSGIDDAGFLIKNKAYGYDKVATGIIPAQLRNLSPIKGAGAMYSNATDLSKWLKALFLTDKLIKSRSRELLLKPFIGKYSQKVYEPYYAMGILNGKLPLKSDSTKMVTVYWHDGILSGTYNVIAFLPEKKTSIIILTNLGFNANPVMKIFSAIVDLVNR
jgi:CubicO group peptidase (beta-lactamase class C family)